MAERHTQSSLASLLGRARRREPEAVEELFRRMQPRLRVYIRSRMGDSLRQRVDVEDVLQETLMVAFDSLVCLDRRPVRAFPHWLARIAEHVIRRLHRYHSAQKRCMAREVLLSDVLIVGGRRRGPHRHPLEDPAFSPVQALAQKERLDRLIAALDQLDHDRRRIVVLARLRELPMSEVAEIMDRGKAACSMLLLRALRDLQAKLRARGPRPRAG